MANHIELALEEIDAKIADLQQTRTMLSKLVGGDSYRSVRSTSTVTAPGRQRREMSPEAKQRIKAAQQKRWADIRKAEAAAPVVAEATPATEGATEVQSTEPASATQTAPTPIAKAKAKAKTATAAKKKK